MEPELRASRPATGAIADQQASHSSTWMMRLMKLVGQAAATVAGVYIYANATARDGMPLLITVGAPLQPPTTACLNQ